MRRWDGRWGAFQASRTANCKGPEIGGSLVCSRDTGQASMAGTKKVRRTVLRHEFGELAGARS